MTQVFTYNQTPKFQGGLPPLADFMLRSHDGYCQMYSGSMALMLRMHGIPARVAVGFRPQPDRGQQNDVQGHRPQCPRLGRGVVRGLRLAAVRPDAEACAPQRASTASRT